MAAALNFILGPYAKVFTLLEAHAPTAGRLKVANEVRADLGKLYPEVLDAKQPADFPRVYLRRPRLDGTMFTEEGNTTFAQENQAFDFSNGVWEGHFTLTLGGKIVHDAVKETLNSQFEVEFLTALLKGGPKWGLGYVESWQYQSTTIETNKEEAANRNRQVTSFTIPVKVIVTADELLNS